ncbi:glutamine synthetase [Lasius niger]|uniref:Glutamine synthetase n=1 Tax=Lasius niger TaxID=67767 RepID=A0A0J7MSJ2_LASNI|nr:glutamine synthetase [Lasius niger]
MQPVLALARVAAGAGQGDPAGTGKLGAELAERDLQPGGLRRVAHQQVGDLQRRLIQRAAGTDAQTAKSFTAQILHRGIDAGAQNNQHTPSFCGTKRTLSPGRSSVGGISWGLNNASGVRPISCQPPGVASG